MKDQKIPVERRELWRASELAAVLGTTQETIYRLNQEELIPAPIHVDGVMRFRADEIRDWLAAGAPERSRWQWRRTLPQKLDDLIRNLQRQKASLEHEVHQKKRELGQNQALLDEADAGPG